MISDNEEYQQSLVLSLQRATHATLRLLAARLAEEDLGASEMNTLANLADGRVRTVGELAVSTGTKPTTLTSVLDRLSGRGYVTRELDPADRRSFLLRLTPDGRRVAEATRAAMAVIEADAVASLTTADVAGFHKVVRALEDAAR